MRRLIATAAQKWARDSELPFMLRLAKARDYAFSVVTAKAYLATVTHVASGVRSIGKPRIDNQGSMSLGENTVLRSVPTPLELCTSPEGTLIIGRECSINYGVSIAATKSVTIGDRVRMGPFVFVIDNQFHELYARHVTPESQPIVIEDDVWIGAKATVMPGVRIGRGAVVGAHAVVTKDVPAFTIWGGVPAKQIGALDPAKLVIG